MHENEGLKTYQVRKNLIKLEKYLREIEEMKSVSHKDLYIEP